MLGILLVPLALGAFWERAFANATYDGIAVGPHRINCRIRYGRLLWLYATNVAGVLLTLGLFYPWALIRRIRYQFECMSADVQGSLDEFAAAAAPEASATGEAIGEVFDAHARVLDAAGYQKHRMNATGYSLGAVYAPNWMDWPMFYHGNPELAAPGQVYFIHLIVFDSEAGLAMTSGQTVLVTEGAAEVLSKRSTELVVR